MATKTLQPGLVLRPMRVFRNLYRCDRCGDQWDDEMLTVSYSWCPFCSGRTEPYESEALICDMVCDADEDDE